MGRRCRAYLRSGVTEICSVWEGFGECAVGEDDGLVKGLGYWVVLGVVAEGF